MVAKLDLKIAGSGELVDRAQLSLVKMPVATESWYPLAHHALLEGVEKTLRHSGLEVVNESHLLAHEGNRYFGLLQVAGQESDYSLVIGLRNSHDKSIVAGLAVGSGVHVCSNLAFSSEIVIERKHTRYANRDMPSLIESAVGRLGDLRRSQDMRIQAYKRSELSDAQVHDLVVQALDARIVPVTRIPDVLKEWRTPRHPEFAASKSAWRLMNSFTEVLRDSNLFKRPVATQALHGLLDTASGLSPIQSN
jgi:hypothetical protein